VHVHVHRHKKFSIFEKTDNIQMIIPTTVKKNSHFFELLCTIFFVGYSRLGAYSFFLRRQIHFYPIKRIAPFSINSRGPRLSSLVFFNSRKTNKQTKKKTKKQSMEIILLFFKKFMGTFFLFN